MNRRIAIIQGHPDASIAHLLHAMAEAYADAATVGGHEVRRIEVAKLEFPLLRTQVELRLGHCRPLCRSHARTCAGRSTG